MYFFLSESHSPFTVLKIFVSDTHSHFPKKRTIIFRKILPNFAKKFSTYQSQHALVLFDGAAASEEADDEDEGAHADEYEGGRLQIRIVSRQLDHFQVLDDIGVDFQPDANA